MNRGCKVESYSNKYFPNTSLTKTREPLCLDDNKKKTDCLPWIMASIPYFLLRTYNSVENIPTISAIGHMP